MMEKYIDTSFDEKFKLINSLNWLPFIGKSYLEEKNKTLILGESHYIPENEDSIMYNDKNWTRCLILKEGLQIKPWNLSPVKNNLIREIEKTLNGKIQNDFWNKIAFFNLIQRLLPSIKGQDRPNYEDIKFGLLNFKKLVSLLEPDRIIFCGTESSKHFKNLLSDDNFKIEKHKCPEYKINNTYPKSFELEFNNKKIISYFIKHPSTYYTAEKWREFILEI